MISIGFRSQRPTPRITPKTKAIIAVSLYGQPCELDQLNQLTNNQYTNTPIYLIVDGAQSFRATYKGEYLK